MTRGSFVALACIVTALGMLEAITCLTRLFPATTCAVEEA